MSFCSRCGAQLEAGEIFCGSCGQPVQGSAPKAAPSIDVKKAFVDYFKYPVSGTKNLVYALELKFTLIITAVLVLLTAYIPFKPIKTIASAVTTGLGFFGNDNELSKGISSKVNSFYFSFLLFVILFFGLFTVLVLACGAVRGKKESFLRILNLVILTSIPAVITFLFSALFGVNTFSILLIIFGLTLSGILLYSQLKEVLSLSDMDSFIALVVVNALSYGITFYIAFSAIKSQFEALNNLF